jgi:hypothetical protein
MPPHRRIPTTGADRILFIFGAFPCANGVIPRLVSPFLVASVFEFITGDETVLTTHSMSVVVFN